MCLLVWLVIYKERKNGCVCVALCKRGKKLISDSFDSRTVDSRERRSDRTIGFITYSYDDDSCYDDSDKLRLR